MTATTRGSPVGGNDTQGQAPDGQSQPPLPQNQTSSPNSSNENSPVSPPDEQGQGDCPPQLEEEEPAFPHTDLAKLDDMINRPRWVVPVLPKGELEVLLEAAIDLSKKGVDVKCEACQRFFRDGLTISFTKILTDEAVSGWKFEIHRCIINNTHRLVELCVAKLSQDWFPLLELLAMALNPHCKFHIYNGTRPSETVPAGAQLAEDELFARPPDPRSPKGWLVDLINKFGTLSGFQLLHDRFTSGQALNVQIIAALIKLEEQQWLRIAAVADAVLENGDQHSARKSRSKPGVKCFKHHATSMLRDKPDPPNDHKLLGFWFTVYQKQQSSYKAVLVPLLLDMANSQRPQSQ
ncbi:USP9X hydrolase, partial [Polypterus senegalus]